ncbi:MAG TPA: protease inhibitor I42 family protein [Solirubrobacterales bacterium]|jgi:predicted secreted protein|nr:protease inhibitor I42 family protein [Solirubrobacterales bacterium]
MGSDADEAIELRVGEEHSVTLPGLGTAGYRWAPEIEGDAEVADVSRAGGKPPEAGGAVGASAEKTFTIRGKRPGSVRIRFAQRRPWDPADAPPANERTIRLQVS